MPKCDAMAGVIYRISKKVPQKAPGSAGAAYGRYDVKKENADGTTTNANGSRNMSKTYAAFGNKITDNSGYYIHYNYESADDIVSNPLTSFRHSFLGKLDVAPRDNLNFSVKTELTDYEKVDNREEDSYRVSGIMDFQLAEDHTLSLKGYTYKWDFSHGYPGYSYGYKYGDVGFNQAELQYTWNASDWNTLVVGGEAQIQDIDYIMENPDGSVVTVKEDVKTSSLFIQDEARLFDVLTLVGGARYDDHSIFGDEINPKLSIMYTPAKDTIIRASVGTSFKSPTIRQLYYNAPYLHGSFYALSNPDLKPETAIGYGASIEQWFLDNQMMLNLGYFRNDVDEMVIREDTGALYNGLPLMTYENVEKAWTQGIEFMCTAFLTRELTAGFSYTYTDTENEETGKELTYVARHVASFSPAFDWEKYGMGVSARVSYSSKQYTDSANTSQIDAGAVLGAKIYKNLSESAKLSFEMDDIFDSAQASVGSFHSGRSFTLKLDFKF
jgi:outer membrane receptor for ferrienterochelin and colicins